jgi:enoyl-CoA hydratase/carnithine racemase
MTGERIGPDEAARIGLVQEVVETLDQGLERAWALSRMVSRRSPTAVAAFKRALQQGLGHSTEERLTLEARAYDWCVDTGEAAAGRANFGAIRSGEAVDWADRYPLKS